MMNELDRAYATIGRLQSELDDMRAQRDAAIQHMVEMAEAEVAANPGDYPELEEDEAKR